MSGQIPEQEKHLLQGKNYQIPVSPPNANQDPRSLDKMQRAPFLSPTDNMFSPCTKKIMSRRGPNMGQKQLLAAVFKNQAQKENTHS